MRTITPAIVKKWKPLENRNDPQPLPGNYPTRWLIEGDYYIPRPRKGPRVTHRRLFYFGKPNMTVAQRIVRGSDHWGGNYSFWEFDQGGLIKWAFRPLPTNRHLVDGYARRLCGLYYFRNGSPDTIFAGRQSGHWGARKKLTWDGHSIIVYDNGEPWEEAFREAAKLWLQNEKFEWK